MAQYRLQSRCFVKANGYGTPTGFKDGDTIADYAEAMTNGVEFPPVVLFRDGESYWPGDGHHRIHAARDAGRETILAEVRQGGRREAMLAAVSANATHGLRRTQADKRRAVTTMLTDPEWAKWSDRSIAKQCAVDGKTVAAIRRELTAEIRSDRTFKNKNGKIATMRTAAIGKANDGGSILERMLAEATTEQLIGECHRRGLEVSS